MNVILLEKVGKLGDVGDVANVKSGYARNYLFPSGIAIPATKSNLAEFEERRADLMAVHNEKLAAAQARADKINGMAITIQVNASDEGKLFGSVGTKDISDAVNEKGGESSKSEVQLPHGAIREIGDFEITLDLGFDIQAQISLKLEPLAGATPPIVDTETGEELAAQSEESAEESAEETAEESVEESTEETAEVTAEDSTAESEDASEPVQEDSGDEEKAD